LRYAGTGATGCPNFNAEELLAEHGTEVDHVTVYRWVQRFTRFTDAARQCQHSPRKQRFVDHRARIHFPVWRQLDDGVEITADLVIWIRTSS